MGSSTDVPMCMFAEWVKLSTDKYKVLFGKQTKKNLTKSWLGFDVQAKARYTVKISCSGTRKMLFCHVKAYSIPAAEEKFR